MIVTVSVVLIHDVVADVFTLDVAALAHGVNVDGVMGAGVARAMRGRYPEMYETYRRRCLTGELSPGACFPHQTETGIWVYNLASQDRPGPTARIEWIVASVVEMVAHAAEHEIGVVGSVRIGCGIGGLRWGAVRAALETVATDVELLVATPK